MERIMANPGLENDVILVLGGTGKTGRRVADLLQQAGHRVRIGSRTAEPPFDWENRDSWRPALQGVRAAYVAYQPDLAAPGAVETVDAFFRQASDSGVGKLVLLSGRGEVEAEQAEQALQESGVDWTILRASWFFQNFSEGVFRDFIAAGEVALPSGPAAEPFVDVDDIAEIAFAALTQAGHSRKLYELTGPRALTFAEAIGEIAQAAGREVKFIATRPEDFRAQLVASGVPGADADLVIYLFTTVLDGRNTPLADGVQRALGRPARDFSDYVRRTAATGVWGGDHA
jgi:uncharacterized protein YbjT (DUF2867 family)